MAGFRRCKGDNAVKGWGGVKSPLKNVVFFVFVFSIFLLEFGNTHDSVLYARGDEQTNKKLKQKTPHQPTETRMTAKSAF